MDFKSMKRKQLQALCKKHGVPANLSNHEMTDRLSSILKENKKLASKGKTLLENSPKKVNENDSKPESKVEKKVRFSPENQTFFYEVSVCKRVNRGICKMKPVQNKTIQGTENDVGRKRSRKDVKNQRMKGKSSTKSDVVVLGDGSMIEGMIRRQLRNREVMIERSNGNLVASKKSKLRRAKIDRDEVPEENDIASKDAKHESTSKPGGRVTRSCAQFVGRDSEVGQDHGDCEKVPQLEEPLKGVGRNALMKKSIEADKDLQKTKQDVARDEGREILTGKSRKVENVGRITRSQAKSSTAVCVAESKIKEETIQPEEPSKDFGKYASRRKSVVHRKDKVVSDGAKEKKETRNQSRNADLEGASELDAVPDTNKKFEMVMNVSTVCPSRRTRHNTLMLKSAVSTDGDLETHQNVGQQGILRRSRRNALVNVATHSEPNVVKNPGCEILSSNPKKIESVNRTIKSEANLAGIAFAAQSETEEENVRLEEPSISHVKHTSRRKSVVSQKVEVVSDGLHEEKETRKRSRNTDLKGALELEAIVEPSKKLETSGPSRRTRSKTVMLKSTTSTDEVLKNLQTAGQKNADLTKRLPRRSSQHASRDNPTITSSEVDGIVDNVRKVRQQKRRHEPILDEDSSLSDRQYMIRKALKQSTCNTSNINFVDPPGSTCKAVGKKQHVRSKMPNVEQNAPCSVKLSVHEDGKLAAEKAVKNVEKLDASSSKQVPESLKEKRKANQGKIGANKQRGSIEAPTITSDIEEAVDTTVNLEGISVSTLVMLPSDSLNRTDDFADGNPEEPEMAKKKNSISNVISSEITSPAASFSPSNQSDDSGEPLNIMNLGKVHEAVEPSLGKNINNGSDCVDDHTDKDDRSLAQEYQNLAQLEDVKESTARPHQEAVFEEHLFTHNENSSEEKYEIPHDKTEGTSHTESLLEAIEMQEPPAESPLVTTEIGKESATEIQLSTFGSVTKVIPCKPTSDGEGKPLNNVNLGKVHAVVEPSICEYINHGSDNVDDHTDKANKTLIHKYQNLAQLEDAIENTAGPHVPEAVLEEHLIEHIGKSSEKKSEIAHYISEGIRVVDPSDAEGTSHNESFLEAIKMQELAAESPLVTTEMGKERTANLQLCICGDNVTKVTPSKPTFNGGEVNKANELLERCTQEAMEKENEFSEQNTNVVSDKTRGKCMHESSDANGINMIVTEAMGIDAAHDDVDKGSFHYELAILKNHNEHGKDGSLVAVSSDCSKSLSCKHKLSVHNDLQETLKAKLNEVVQDGLKAELQEDSMLQSALEELQDGVENDTSDAIAISGKVLCKLNGDCNPVNVTEVQVCADSCVNAFKECIAVNSSKLVSEKTSDDENLIGKRSCSVDITEENLSSDKSYVANKGINTKDFNGESNIELCDDVVKESIRCALKVDLGDKGDLDVVAPQVNGTSGTSLTDIIFEETEALDGKAIEKMMKPAFSLERVENLTVEELKSERRNSDTKVTDVCALVKVTGNQLLEEDAMEVNDSSVQNVKSLAVGEAHTVVMKRMDCLEEAPNFEIFLSLSPMISRKISRDEFYEANNTDPGFVNEVIAANGEDLEERSNKVMSLVQPVDKAKFGDFENYNKENVLELERSASFTSNNLVSIGGKVDDRKEIIGIIGDDIISNDRSSDTQKEHSIDAIPQVTENDIDDHLPEVELCNSNDRDHSVHLNFASSNIGVEADDAAEVSVDGIYSENVKAGTEWMEKILTFSETTKSGTERVNDTADSDSPFDMDDHVTEKTTSAVPKDYKNLSDSIHDPNVEDKVRSAAKQPDDHMDAAMDVEVTAKCMVLHGESTLVGDVSKQGKHDDLCWSSNRMDDFADGNPVEYKKQKMKHSTSLVISSETISAVTGFSPSNQSDDSGEPLNIVDLGKVHEAVDSSIGKNIKHGSDNADDHTDKDCKPLIQNLPQLDDVNENNAGPHVLAAVLEEDLIEHRGNISGKKSEIRLGITEGISVIDPSDAEGTSDTNSFLEVMEMQELATESPLVTTETGLERTTEIRLSKCGDNVTKTTKSEREDGEKNSADGISFAITFDKTKMHIENDTVDKDSPFNIDDHGTKETTSTNPKDFEGLNDSIHVPIAEDNARSAAKQSDNQKGAEMDTAVTSNTVCVTSKELSCCNRRKSITEVAREGISNMVSDMLVTADIEEFPTVSSLTTPMCADFSAVTPIILHSNYESKSSEFHIDSPRLTSREMKIILGTGEQVDFEKSAGEILEANLMTQVCEDAVQVKENLRTNDLFDKQITEEHNNEQEHHTHLAVLDEPVCKNEEANQPDESSKVCKDYTIHEIQTDKSDDSSEKVTLIEGLTSCSSVAERDELGAEYVDGLREPENENIAVDPGVFSCSGSRGNSTEKEVHTEAAEKMDIQEVNDTGTILPFMPYKLSEHLENTKDTSQEITGTVLQQIISSGAEWKQKFCGPLEQEEIENSEAGALKTNMFSEDVRDVKENVAIKEQVPAQVTEKQLSEQKMAEEVSKFNSTVYSDLDEHTCKGGEGSKEQESLLAIIHGTPENEPKFDIQSHMFTNHQMKLSSAIYDQNEIKNAEAGALQANSIKKDTHNLKENVMTIEQPAAEVTKEQLSEHNLAEEVSELNSTMKSATGKEPVAKDPWKLEMKLLSPRQRSAEAKAGGNTLSAKMLNYPATIQSKKSTMIQRTPKQLIHNMKENFSSTKTQIVGNITMGKTFSKRRALEDLQKK